MPKPTAVKLLAGNPGKRPLNKGEPQPEQIEAPGTPRGLLGKDGRKLWRELAPRLSRNGLLTELDLPALTMMCVHYDAAMQAARAIRDHGVLTVDRDGMMRKTPASQVLRDHSKSFQGYADRFGLSPSARVRIVVEAAREEPSLAEILRGEFNVVRGGAK